MLQHRDGEEVSVDWRENKDHMHARLQQSREEDSGNSGRMDGDLVLGNLVIGDLEMAD